MDFCGEIVFAVSDSKNLNIDFETGFLPTKIITKGERLALGKKAPANRWIHVIKFYNQHEYLEQFEKLADQLLRNGKYVNELINTYERVSINIYIRSDYAELGYSLPVGIIKKLALLECPVNYSILSFGMAVCEW